MKSKGSIFSVCFLLFFAYNGFWTCCDDVLKLFVFAGHRSLSECQTLANQYQHLANENKITFVCPGEEVTIYWESTASTVDLDGFGTKNSPGIEYVTVAANQTVKATANSDCKISKSFKIMVVGSHTRSTHLGVVTVDCKKISFEVERAFYSPKIMVESIEPRFGPSAICPGCVAGNKFLDMHHNGYDKEISTGVTNFSVSDSLQALGKWDFDIQCCGPGCDCNPYSKAYEFWLNLNCP